MRVCSWTRPGRGGSRAESEYLTDDWECKVRYFQGWLGELKKFILAIEEHSATPDLWSGVHSQEALVQRLNSASLGNLDFSVDEQKYIAVQLRELAAFIQATNAVEKSQLEEIKSRFKYLEEASTRIGRKDWLNILFATLVAIVVSVVLPPEMFDSLYNLTLRLPLP